MASMATLEAGEDESNYGSDFSPEEEEIVNTLLSPSFAPVETVEDNPIVNNAEYHEVQGILRVPKVPGGNKCAGETATDHKRMSVQTSDEFRDQNEKNVADSPHSAETSIEEMSRVSKNDQPDIRSPLQRFRSAPRKPLSVTDLVSPSWCELQYWYMLTIHGRKKSTKEMVRGTAVHEQLEAEIYTTVQVNLRTKEDSWGLKIWNVIQGLSILEEIGQTRELHVWGIIEGELVNGIIDEVSFSCPDTELEEKIEQQKITDPDELPADQTIISEFFKATDGRSPQRATRKTRLPYSTKAYICDVKTRSASALPKGGSFRPTEMQLMLYYRLLGDLATERVDFSMILDRFQLDGNACFSDEFISQIGCLNDDFFPSQESLGSSNQDSTTLLLENNSLNALWSLMIKQFQRILPHGKASIGKVLKAEYRSRHTGDVMGVKTFPMDEKLLEAYVKSEMKWWKGEREPKGVVIEEAYKCQSCEYADTCDWRLERAQEARDKARQRKKVIKGINKSTT